MDIFLQLITLGSPVLYRCRVSPKLRHFILCYARERESKLQTASQVDSLLSWIDLNNVRYSLSNASLSVLHDCICVTFIWISKYIKRFGKSFTLKKVHDILSRCKIWKIPLSGYRLMFFFQPEQLGLDSEGGTLLFLTFNSWEPHLRCLNFGRPHPSISICESLEVGMDQWNGERNKIGIRGWEIYVPFLSYTWGLGALTFVLGKVGYPCFWADNPDTGYQIPLLTHERMHQI